MKILLNLKATICRLITVATFGLTAQAQTASMDWKAPVFADTIKNPLVSTADNINQGGKIYLNACASCHGYTGKGNGPAAEALKPKPADHTTERVQNETDGALFYKITTGRGLMQPYKSTLTVKQRWQLILYIRSLAQTGILNTMPSK